MKIKNILTVLSMMAAQFLFLSAVCEAAESAKNEAGVSEESTYKGEVNWNVSLSGYGATDSSLPFWARTNKHGLVPDGHGGLLIGGANLKYLTKPQIEINAGLSLAGTAVPGNWRGMADELYFGIGWKKIHLDLGMKDRVEDCFSGLSLTGGDIILTANTRNFAGYNLRTDFITIPGTKNVLALKANFADYKPLDKRYVTGELFHNQALYARISVHRRVDIILGLELWSQWAGTMPSYGGQSEPFKQPSTFEDYLRVILCMSGGSDATRSDQVNALGNHLGRELIRVDWKQDDFTMIFQHDIPFEDGSGMGFQNFPDGVNTIAFSFNDKRRWVSDIIYEFVYTKWQSGTRHERPAKPDELERDPDKLFYIIGGMDNYFNNGEYRSGWTYYGNTIGLPLITPVPANSDGVVLGVSNNRLTAHHLGIAGMIARVLPYKFMATYSRNFGTYRQPFEERLDQVSLVLETTLPNLGKNVPLSLTLGLYGDMGEMYPDNFGMTLKLTWTGRTTWR